MHLSSGSPKIIRPITPSTHGLRSPTSPPPPGFVSDSFPLFGYRRRSYLLLASGAGGWAWQAEGIGLQPSQP